MANKFISKENFVFFWEHLKTLLAAKLTTPEGGSTGQVLTKTDSGTEWKTVEVGSSCDCESLTENEMKEILNLLA